MNIEDDKKEVSSIKSLMDGYKKKLDKREKPERELKEFQIWALEFAKKYDCRSSMGLLMKYGKKFEDNVDYLRYLDSWLDDYPRRTKNVVPLLLWKIKEDGFARAKSTS